MTSLMPPPVTVRFALNGAEVAATTAGGRRLLDVPSDRWTVTRS